MQHHLLTILTHTDINMAPESYTHVAIVTAGVCPDVCFWFNQGYGPDGERTLWEETLRIAASVSALALSYF